ncbi:uncharacterized protein PAC_17139 [Phialocephala subalpina]|uniref:Uncharacterized protein n=1 Tax=Phialocephala subalpina TaxID=576137 RepID=A0A1L7XQC8_9HELO|nr:uncharacterized protein PAC_17139 [Phialocephala subalpina]
MSNLCVGSLYTVVMSYKPSQADPNNEIVLRTIAPDNTHLLDLYDTTNPPAGTWIHVAKTFKPTLETMRLAIIFLEPSSKVYTVDDLQFTLGDSTASYTSSWSAFPTPTNTAYSTTTNPPMSTQATAVPSGTSSSTTSSALACNTAPVLVNNSGFESGYVAPWNVLGDSLQCACIIPAASMPSSGYTILDLVIPNPCAGVTYTVSTEVQTRIYNAEFSEIVLQVWDTGYLHYQVAFDTMLPPSAVNNWFSVSGNFVSSGNGLILRFIMLADLVDTYYTLDNIVLSVAGSTPPTTSSSTSSMKTMISSSTTTLATLTNSTKMSSTTSTTTSTTKRSTTSTTPSTSTSSAPSVPTWPLIPGVCPIQFFQVATFDLPSSPFAFSDPSSPSLSLLTPSSDPQNSWGIVSPGFLSEYAFAAYNVGSPTSAYSGTTLAAKLILVLNRESNTYINIFVDGAYVISDRADGTAVSSYPLPANEPGWYFAKGSFYGDEVAKGFGY